MGGSGSSRTARRAQSSTWRFRPPPSPKRGKTGAKRLERASNEASTRRRRQEAARASPGRPSSKSVGNRIRQAGLGDDTVGMTVLIVDDHPSFRASARTLLEAEGYE